MNKISFRFAMQGRTFKVERFDVTESLSTPFHVKLSLLFELPESSGPSTDTNIALGELIRQPALLTLYGQGQDNARVFHGRVNEAHYLGQGRKFARYQVSLVPQLWFLTQRQDCRIFQHLPIPDIISSVLKKAKITDFRLSLSRTYLQKEYVLQYRETDYHFIQRLLAENGMWYYFEHNKTAHTMVIVDSNDAIPPLISGLENGSYEGPILYHDPGGGIAEQEHISHLSQINRVRSAHFSYTDYNYEQPAIPQFTDCEGEEDSDLAQFDYPGRYTNVATGKTRPPQWMAGHRVDNQQMTATSDVMRLATGFSFFVTGHLRKEINQEYTLISVNHRGSDPSVHEEEASGMPTTYQNSLTCIARNVLFNAPKMPAPVVDGPQSAVVVGPENEEIFTDELGRIKVQFHWDRYGKKNAESSCWVRVCQSMAGSVWGAVCLPRIGHEVIVTFLDGDPDRPLVTGCVYNGLHLPPYPLPKNKTRTTFRTQTYKGSGYNELSFEDEANNEQVYIHAQKDMLTEVLNHRYRDIGQDEFLHVGRDQKNEIKGNHSEMIFGDKTTKVNQTFVETVEQDVNVTYNANETKKVKNNVNATVGDNQTITVGKNDRVDIGENSNLSIGASRSSEITSDDNQTVGGSLTVSVSRNVSFKSDAATQIISADTIVLKTGNASLVMKSDGSIKISGTSITIEGSDKVILKGAKVAINP